MGIPHSRFLSWSEDDQDKALAFLRDRSSVCSGCGTRQREWEGDRFAFVAQSTTCLGCEVIEMERDNIHEGAKGVRIFLSPRVLASSGGE